MLLTKSRIIIAVVLISMIVVSNSAFAGFKLKRTSDADSEYIGSRKVDEVDREIITSIISSENVPVKDESKKEGGDTSSSAENKGGEEDLVTGFGQDLPLLISLQQIIPTKYKFTVEQGVDSKVLTSWEGGKSWRNVLDKMLSPQGLAFVEADGSVVIKSKLAKQVEEKIVATKAPEANVTTEEKPAEEKKVVEAPTQIDLVANTNAPTAITKAETPVKAEPASVTAEEKKEDVAPVEEKKELVSTEVAKDIKSAIDKEIKENSTKKLNKKANKSKGKTSATKVANVNTPHEEEFKSLYDSRKRRKTLAEEEAAPVNIVMKDKSAAIGKVAIANKSRNVMKEEIIKEIEVARPIQPSFEYQPDAAINPDWRMAKAKWVGHRGQTLKEVLGDWCKTEGVELYWAMDYDYKLGKDIAYGGEYEVAVARVINLFKKLRPQPYGQLHKGARGPLVLVVNSYDLSH